MDEPKPINPDDPRPLDYESASGRRVQAPLPVSVVDEFPRPPARFRWIFGLLALLAIIVVAAIVIEIPRYSFASRPKCQANLQTIGAMCNAFCETHNGKLPADFEELLLTTGVNSAIFVCPASNDTPAEGTLDEQAAALAGGGHLSYIWLGDGASRLVSPDVVLAYEPLSNHANAGIHVLFSDYHVEWLEQSDAQKLIDSIAPGEPTVWPPVGGR